MKKSIFLSVSFVLVSLIGTAQNNTLPTTGNVGIGTTNPIRQLHLNKSSGSIYQLLQSGSNFLGIGLNNAMQYGPTFVFHENSQLRIGKASGITSSSATNFVEFLRINNTGNVGIGTTNPTAKLHIKDPEGGAAFNIERGGKIWNFSIQHTGNNLFLNNSDTPNTFFTFTKDGKFGIGTTSPDTELAVNGKIHAKEVKVDLTGWPDYVFENDYSLPSLQEVENHIVKKGHLPNIPSASEVEKNGIQLGEMNAKLLQKIEELTLYMIAQNKKTEQLQKEIELLKKNMK
ncbi:hypothetical protein [Aquimarina macrocephali]|uniref:hypothetical protein n=1 Tax=Aquimarina macrocephali TaxID=666563 RepID=UPI000465F7BA|nr:hypothetical protein [Aquimarina macrocephali]